MTNEKIEISQYLLHFYVNHEPQLFAVCPFIINVSKLHNVKISQWILHFFGRQSMSFVDCELRAIVDTLVYAMMSADFAAGISSCLMREPLRQKHETFLLFAWSHEANLLWLLVRISILYTNISRGFFLPFFLWQNKYALSSI